MKSSLYQVSNTHVLAIQEAITQAECAELKDLILQAGTVSGAAARLALDLSEVPFMDSATLELLLQMTKEFGSKGGRLRLVALSPNCDEILRLTDLRGRLEVHGSVEEATRRGS